MRTPGEILATLRNEPPVPTTNSRPDDGTVAVINALFRELMAIFPAWKQAWPDDKAVGAAKVSWTKAFMAERITKIEQIRHGIEQCRKRTNPFAPSVGEFIEMSRPTPEMLGLPSLQQAMHEAVSNAHPAMAATAVWTHEAVYHAATEVGFHNLRSLQAESVHRLFERSYSMAVRAILSGEPLRTMPKALPEKVSVRTETTGRKALAALRAGRSARA